MNCAGGGPNRGFTIAAHSVGLACASGRWQRGRYSFVTETFEPKRKLRAVASLLWSELDRC